MLTVDLPAPDPRISIGEEAPGSLIELATFCKTQGPNDGAKGAGDPQRPGVVLTGETYDLTVCPADDTMAVQPLTNVDPSTWYVRVQFDELLDPKIEDLVPITDANGNATGTSMGTLKNTQPVTLQCQSSAATGNGAMVDIPYDGYYDPSGDSVSYPLGPSLVIQPSDPTLVATGSMCQITLKTNIKDKDGNQVPTDQLGPYAWTVGTIAVTAISPMDGSTVDPIAAGVDLTFNAVIDPTSVMYTYSPTVANSGVAPEAANEVFVFGDFPAASPTYNFGVTSVADQCGKTTMLGTPSDMNNTATSFSTNPLALSGITDATDPGSQIVMTFNNYMDPTSLTQFTLTPAINGAATPVINAPPGPTLTISNGQDQTPGSVTSATFKLGTAYTFTLNAGAAIKDCPGGETGACDPTIQSTYTNGAAQVVAFTTDPAITLNNVAPMDSSTIDAGTAVDLTFNQTITDASVQAAITAGNITVDPAVTLAEVSDGDEDVAIGPGPLDPTTGAFAPWPPGTYTFTIKAAASFSDGITGDAAFTPGMDTVIHFTVPPPATGGTAPTCF
ncbi:MAG TPA: hypothetical protein VGG74_16750 [Kofleriaceae bacterium]